MAVSFILRHKLACAGGLGLAVVLMAVMVATAVSGGGSGPLTDLTSCTEWSSASSAQRAVYSQLLYAEHGAATRAARDPGSIESTISNGCVQAAYRGESDEITLVAAVKHQY